MNKKHILCLPSWYPYKGDPTHGIFAKKLIKSVSDEYNITVLFVSPAIAPQEEVLTLETSYDGEINEVRVFYRIDDIKLGKLAAVAKLRRYRKAVKLGASHVDLASVDLCHVHVAHPAGRIALWLKNKFQIPYVITEQWTGYTAYDNSFEGLPFYNKSLIKKTFSNAEAYSGVSGNLVESIYAKGFAPAQRMVTNNIVDVNPITATQKSTTCINIITISDLRDDQKNLSGLLNVMERLQRERKVKLTIIGDGKDRDILKHQAKKLNLDNSVEFAGYVPNKSLGAFFNQAHFFVLNSNYETFSVANAEAIGYGLPVVVTKCGAPEEYVVPEVGILVERKNEESLYEGMSKMCDDYGKYDAKMLNDYAISRFSSQAIGKKIKSIYAKVI